MYDFIPDNPYLLLTPGPLSTSKGVRNALLRDWCTWDDDYNKGIVQVIRKRLVELACADEDNYTAVLMQGSGSFGVESCLGSVVPQNGKLLIVTNGAYGKRMVKMCQVMDVAFLELSFAETEAIDVNKVECVLCEHKELTHMAAVHCETTTGILNPLEQLSALAKKHKKIMIADAMSSFGGIPIPVAQWGIDFLISSSNKCIQGVPGFSFIIANRQALSKCENNAKSYSLDLYDQWKTMDKSGKWRFTSPTHVVRAFYQAIEELLQEGGPQKRFERYSANQKALVEGMEGLGLKTLLSKQIQSPFITSFLYPYDGFDFIKFYMDMKEKGFVLYPGKISQAETFRIGTIGEIYLEDIQKLIKTIQEALK